MSGNVGANLPVQTNVLFQSPLLAPDVQVAVDLPTGDELRRLVFGAGRHSGSEGEIAVFV